MEYTTNSALNAEVDAATVSATIYIKQNYTVEQLENYFLAHQASGIASLPIGQQLPYLEAFNDNQVANSIASQIFSDAAGTSTGMSVMAETGAASVAAWGADYTQKASSAVGQTRSSLMSAAAVMDDAAVAFKWIGGSIAGIVALAAVIEAGPNAENEVVKQGTALAASTVVTQMVTSAVTAALVQIAGPVIGRGAAALVAVGSGIVAGVMILDSWDYIQTGLDLNYTHEQILDGLMQRYEDKFDDFMADAEEIASSAMDVLTDQIVNPAAEHIGDAMASVQVLFQQAEAMVPMGGWWDPVILDLDGDGIELTDRVDSTVYFNISGTEFQHVVAWSTGGDGMLVDDLNTNGVIDDVDEIIGGNTEGGGFIALQGVYDTNSDGVIDSSDTTYTRLRVWIDSDADGYTDSGELHSLSSLNITSLNLNAIDVNYQIAGNNITQESTFVISGQTRQMVDAWFNFDTVNTVYSDPYVLDARVMFLPEQRGYGELPNLSIAMSLDEDLLDMVTEVAEESAEGLFDPAFGLEGKMRAILMKWAGVDGVTATPFSGGLDAQELAFLEKVMGREYDGGSLGYGVLNSAWERLLGTFSANMLGQVGLSEQMGSPSYDVVSDTLTGLFSGGTAVLRIESASAKSDSGFDDVYVYRPGDGGTSITEIRNGTDDTIFISGIDPVNVTIRTDLVYGSLYRLVISYGSGDDIYVDVGAADTNGGVISESVERIVFEDGTIWDLTQGLHLKNDNSGGGFVGTNHDDTINGGSGDDAIYGHDGNDTLDGGGDGLDTLLGGSGDDTYIVNELDDDAIWVTEESSEGTDTIRIHGVLSTDATLRSYNGWPSGYLTISWGGNDMVYVGLGATDSNGALISDRVERVVFDDAAIWDLTAGLVLKNHNFNSSLYGTNFDDVLEGGTASDTLFGYGGNDIYILAASGDTVFESSNEGIDEVRAAYTYTLGDHVENLTLTGSSNINGTGNSLNNVLTGNSGTNMLTGGAGNDIYVIDMNDTVVEGSSAGVDTVVLDTNTGIYVLASNAEILIYNGVQNGGTTYARGDAGQDYLIGGSNANEIAGNNNDDVLFGGLGNDILWGGNGTDTAIYQGNRADYSITGTPTNGTGGTVTHTASGEADTLKTFEYIKFADGLLNLATSGFTANNFTGAAVTDLADGMQSIYALDATGTLNYMSNTSIRIDGDDGDVVNVDMRHLIQMTGLVTLSGRDYAHYAYGMTSILIEDGIVLNPSSIPAFTPPAGTTVTGTSGNDMLSGTDGNDTINGLAGNDTLDGGRGADAMAGGEGDDIYIVNGIGDTVTEDAAEGTDEVRSNITYTLGANVEKLTLTGTANISGTGNALDNIITGNSGDNTLIGGDGNDVLDGGTGSEVMYGGLGNDTYYVNSGADYCYENASEGTDTIITTITLNLSNGAAPWLQNIENLTLAGSSNISGTGNNLANIITGNSGNNTLYGGGGSDTIDGGVGADTMYGGTGADTYIVDNVNDVVIENAAEGTDTIRASVTYTLAAETDNLVLTGSANIDGTGNGYANVITGNSGNNTLTAGNGHDTIYGGAGNDTIYGQNNNDTIHGEGGLDTLYGGSGADTFVFDIASAFANIDVIKDFSTAQNDKLDIADLLTGYDPLTSAITDFLEITTSGSNSVVKVDRDGSGGTYSLAQIATIEGVTGLTDEAALLTAGHIIAA